MTERRIRDLRRLLESEAAIYGAAVALEACGSGHWRATFNVGQRRAFIITSATPSHPRASKQVAADARRTLRRLTEKVPA